MRRYCLFIAIKNNVNFCHILWVSPCVFCTTIPVLACGLQIILKLLFLAYSSYLCKRTLLFGVVENLSIPALSKSVTQPRHLWLTVCGAHLFFHRQILVDNSMILLVSISFTETPWHQGWGFVIFSTDSNHSLQNQQHKRGLKNTK